MFQRQSRQEARATYDEKTRIGLLEGDMDNAEANQNRIEAKLDSIRTWLVTGAITFASSALLLGINIAISLRK